MGKQTGQERRFTVLLEQVQSEVRMIAEGLTGLDQKVDRGFADVRQEFAHVRHDMNSGFHELTKRLNDHERAHVR